MTTTSMRRALTVHPLDPAKFRAMLGDDNSIYGFYCAQARQRMEGVIKYGRKAPPCRII